jgi:hypothetical protein
MRHLTGVKLFLEDGYASIGDTAICVHQALKILVRVNLGPRFMQYVQVRACSTVKTRKLYNTLSHAGCCEWDVY